MNAAQRTLQDLFTVPDTFDPDDLRLRRVCNVVFAVIGLVSVASAAFSLIGFDGLRKMIVTYPAHFRQLFSISILMFFVSVGLFLLNRWRRTPKYLVGGVLVGMVIFVIPFTDSPHNLLYGWSQSAWVMPILLAAIVLPPRSAFLTYGLVTVLIAILTPAPVIHRLNYWFLLILFIVAFSAWLGMSVAERAIRDARNESQKNRAILDGVVDGVVVVGVNNKVILANPVAFELTDGEIGRVTSAAEHIEIGGRILSVRWSQVQGVGRVAILRDVSRQMEIERAKDAVLGVVSHELRTPLAAIMGFSETLASTSMPNSDKFERIRANAQRMMILVDNLLDQAHIEAGVLRICNEDFSPAKLANAIRNTFCARARDKQIVLTVTVSEALPDLLRGDLRHYQQILANLVDNAVKFTKEGGCVNVLLAPGDRADTWQMVVSDTGIGIPSEHVPDIFLPFRRSSDYTTRSHQGAGLGLSIANRIAQLAHGDIHVKSTVGHGSTFIVTLPTKGDTK